MGLELDGVNGIIKNSTSDGDVTIKGNDGGSEISALTFDMSAEGAATFNSSVTLKDAGGGAGAILNLTSADTSGASGEFLGIINFVSSDSSTGSAGTQAAIKGVYEDNGDSSGLEFFTGNSTGSGTPTLQKRMQMFHDSGVTITTTDNTDTLTLASTDADANSGPNLRLYRNSGSPADSDLIGNVQFEGRNDNSQDVVYAEISSRLNDASDGTEDGLIFIKAMTGGTLTEYMRFDPGSGGIVVNDGSIDMNFRIESDGDTHAFFLEGSTGNIGIGTSSIDVITQAGGSGFRVLQLENNEGGQINLDHTDAGTGSTLGMINFNRAGETVAHIGGVTDGATDSGHINFRTQPASGALTERMRITSDGNVALGTTSVIQDFGDGRTSLALKGSGAEDYATVQLANNGTGSNDQILGILSFYDGGNHNARVDSVRASNTVSANLRLWTAPSGGGIVERMRIHTAGQISTGDEHDSNVDAGGLCLQTNSNDGRTLSFKNSDIAHGMTSHAQTDTYYMIGKNSSTLGGAVQNVFSENNGAKQTGFVLISAMGNGYGGNNQTRASDAGAAIDLRGAEKGSGTSYEGIGGTGNILSIRGHATVKFLFDANGDFHADNSSTTFDEYDDAQLVRAYDLSHGNGVIDSKFDKFVAYNHEKLADLKLVGREEDGTPNSFVNVTGMQRLHNGAIWQQYEKHQKLASAFYKLAEKTIGKEEADKLLTDEEIQLLN